MLIVDDEPEVAEVIAEFAGRAGYDVVTTSTPQAFDELYHDGFDVVILDLWMPEVDGVELIRRLAARGSQARLVLVSGFDRRVLESARQLAVSHGLRVAGALGKPLRLAELTDVLDGNGIPGPRTAARAVQVTLVELQRAFDEDRLIVHYQPQVSLVTGAVVGLEALVRWRLPDGVILPPEMFVQMAEAADLSLALTWRVIEKVAAQAGALAEPWNLSVSVNLPPAALTDITFPDAVLAAVRGTPLAPPRLHFEVTETSLAREPKAALDILTRLRLKGFPLAIDDFGIGYSSLAQLRGLPLSALKVDKTFVRRMDRDPASRAIVERSIALGHDLGLAVVAEGVETEVVWQALRSTGCDIVQGYLRAHAGAGRRARGMAALLARRPGVIDLLAPTSDGLYCEAGGFHVDPSGAVPRALITHAHGDHARPGSTAYLCAAPCVPLLRRRLGDTASVTGIPYGARLRLGEAEVSFHPAGHVLGSAQIRIEARGVVWVVTGDYKRQADPTCEPFEPIACDGLVTEATFALPIYRWPDPRAVARDMLAWWEANRAEGRASVLFCYALGKAQRVLAMLAALSERAVFVHGAIEPLVALYRDAGVAMLPTAPVADTAKGRSFAGELVLAPELAIGTPWMRRFGAHETACASGWMRVRGNRRRRSFDRGFELSDHADWPGLLETIGASGARRVLTTHGYAEPLARYLGEDRPLGRRAAPDGHE